MLAAGDEVRAFEREFAEFVGTDFAIATTNGTTALHAMLSGAGIGAGDTVVTSPFSFIASANAVIHTRAKPIFADINPVTFNLDPKSVREVVRTRSDIAAILPVHLYGLPADMREFRAIADEHDLILLEDAAQAHGAKYEGRLAGSIGDAGAFSFYPTKNMTTGEGGMVTTDDPAIAERTRRLVDHGRVDKYQHIEIGYNYRMTNIQAAIGRDQLNRLPGWVEERQRNASELSRRLAEAGGVDTPRIPRNRTHAFNLYTVRLSDRETTITELEAADIEYGIYYPTTIPNQPAYDYEDNYPEAENASDTVLSLPVHPEVSDEDVRQIGDLLVGGTET